MNSLHLSEQSEMPQVLFIKKSINLMILSILYQMSIFQSSTIIIFYVSQNKFILIQREIDFYWLNLLQNANFLSAKIFSLNAVAVHNNQLAKMHFIWIPSLLANLFFVQIILETINLLPFMSLINIFGNIPSLHVAEQSLPN